MKSSLAVAFLFIVVVGPAVAYYLHHVNAAPHCVAGPDEQCPSDLQLAHRAEMKKLEERYKPPTPTEEDKIRYSGLAQVWNKDAPPGFQWDDQKVRWVKAPPPPAK